MKNQKIIALILASTMVAGSSMMAIAADQTGNTTSTGTLIEHLNREVIDVTLPTVTTTFNYNIDPERIINDANKLVNGSTVTTVTPNENGVYFANAGTAAVNGTVSSNIAADTGNDYVITVPDPTKNTTYTYDGADWTDDDGTIVTGITVMQSDGTTPGTIAANDTITVDGGAAAGQGSYSNSSDVVKFEGKNSVDVDVTVVAEVTAGTNDIALVADEEALAAATTPALLMTMKVGDTSKAITATTGAKAKAKIAGVDDNFEVTVDTNNKYKFDVKSSPTKAWDFTTLQLVGKTNQKTLPDSSATAMTVPTIKLTWTITKADAVASGNWSDGTLWIGKDANTGFSTSGLTVEVSDGGVNYTALANDKYSVNEAGWVSVTWDNIVAGIGSTPTGIAYVRVTDGNTKYVFENK